MIFGLLSACDAVPDICRFRSVQDIVMLCVRAGTLEMLQFLYEQRLLQDVNSKLPLVPDITPPFWPWKVQNCSIVRLLKLLNCRWIMVDLHFAVS